MTRDYNECPDCGYEVEWNEEDRQWIHIDENRGCFLDQRNSVEPMPMAPCQSCGFLVPLNEHLGNDKPDGTSEYLCENCYVHPLELLELLGGE